MLNLFWPGDLDPGNFPFPLTFGASVNVDQYVYKGVITDLAKQKKMKNLENSLIYGIFCSKTIFFQNLRVFLSNF